MTSKISLLIFFSAACATGSPKTNSPAWVEGESPQWPRARFITGVGGADDENSAAERARGELARVFSADVSVNSTIEESESTSNHDGEDVRSFSQNVAQKVRTATQKVLEGADIVARWKDAAAGRYYALAALPKDMGLLAVTEKARELDAEAAGYKAQLARAENPFDRAKAAAKLLALAKARMLLEADSRVLGGGALSGDFDTGSARAEAAKALSALDVVVAASGEGVDAVEPAVISGLNAAGLAAKRGAAADKSDLTASVKVAAESQDAGDVRWKRTRSTASVILQDGRTGKIFASFDLSAREDAIDSGEARRRSLASLAKKVSDKVASAIGDFFANQ